MKFKLFLFFCILIPWINHTTAYAQTQKFVLTGTILDTETNETLPSVVINIKELNLWTTSDGKGNFEFKNLNPGNYTLIVSCLGYESYSLTIKVDRDIERYKLKLKATSLALSEVTVTAKEGRQMNSSSEIGKTALDHLQSTSLSDVMQLLPGSVTSNPNLTAINKISIRDISGNDATNALGTAIIVDGAKLSNDANLQSNSSTSAFSTTSGTGIDARQVPVDNVESVEVIRGVASAEYGDMTSGAVIVRTRAGKSPLEIRFKTDPEIKQVSVGKGFSLGESNGFLNIDGEYAYALNDVRTPSKSFNRLTAQVGYSNIFNRDGRQFSFNVKLNGLIARDGYEKDPDQSIEEIFEAEEQQIKLNLYGNWMVNNSWLTNIAYSFSGSYGRQYNREKEWETPGRVPSISALESGEYVVNLLPYEYFSDMEIEGKPVYLNGKISANVANNYNSLFNKFMLGVEWTSKGNEGKGRTFDEQFIPSQHMRPRSFKDIPYVHEYTIFAEDKVSVPIGKGSLELSAGVRLTNIEAEGVDYDMAVDPRFNARLLFLNKPHNRQGWQQIAFRGGWGILSKMPGLSYLYPEDSYTDKSSFSYNDEANNYSFAVMTTQVDKTNNPDLKLPKSTNMEIGLDLKFLGITANIVYFNEKLKNGFSSTGAARPYYYKEFKSVTESGKTMTWRDGEILVDNKEVGYTIRETFSTYQRPGNGITMDKWGLEYSFDFGKITPISTSIIVNGAYFYNKKINNELYAAYRTGSLGSLKDYPFVCYYAGSSSSSGSNGTKSQRFNTDIRLVTHLPKLRLVVTLSGQCIWIDKTQRLAEYNGRDIRYYVDSGNNIIDGSDPDKILNICVDPISYMDLAGVMHPFTEAERQNPNFVDCIQKSRPTFFMTDTQDPYFLLNVRLTKEIGRLASVAFYANNFTNSKPRRYYPSGGYYLRLNTDISFGAELKIKL